MSVHTIWWLLAIGLGIVELFTGSFYLLVLATGAACAGLAAMMGAGLVVQLLVAAAVSAGGAELVRRFRPPPDRKAASQSPDVNLDIGERLVVRHWDESRRARVTYRGAGWEVELLPGEPTGASEYIVHEVSGNRLLLVAAHPT